MRFLPAGRNAVLVEMADLAEVLGVHAALRRRPVPGVVDVIPAARTVLVGFDATTSYAAVVAAVGAVSIDDLHAEHNALPAVEIGVTYDGEDLAEVAALTGLGPGEVVRRHQAGRYVVAFCGFSPGFGYLAGVDPALQVPRRATPRSRVPAGSVALADNFTAVYPREGPGGWQLLGHSDARLWDLDRDPPALLVPGTRVRFVPDDS